jgi:cyanophycinase
MCPAKVVEDVRRGWIIPIGGGEKKVKTSGILGRFVELCGGADARIAIIPTASQLPDTGARYSAVFGEMGAGASDVVALETRTDCEDPDHLATLTDATGIFFTGGNQLRLSTIIGGTAVAKLIRALNATGMHVAGTSAGAAFIGEHMIAQGQGGPTPRGGKAIMSPGLGLTNRAVVDQHFRERDRLGRLLTALAFNPFATGIGVDEDTAAFIDPDNVVHVYGSGGLTIVDPSDLEYSSMAETHSGKPISLIGIKLHILLAGDRYDLSTRVATHGEAV